MTNIFEFIILKGLIISVGICKSANTNRPSICHIDNVPLRLNEYMCSKMCYIGNNGSKTKIFKLTAL